MESTGQRENSPADGRSDTAMTDTQRMLIQLRDELYDGDWDLFVADLEARLAGKPHVFEIGPMSDKFKETVAEHLRLIEELRADE